MSFLMLSCGAADKATATDTTTNPTTNTTTMVSALKYYNHFPFNNVYTLNVKIGGQTVESVLDTGSSNLLAIGDANTCPGCVNEYGYNSVYKPGATAKDLAETWFMNFAPIGQAEVHGYSDTVSFNGVTLPSHAFGLVTSEKGIPNIWGIAYASGSRPSENPETPLFDALVKKLNIKNQFSLTLCALQGGSNVTLGGYDANLASHLGQVLWTPITAKTYYSVNVSRVYTKAKSTGTDLSWVWEPTSGETSIVDSGTNPMVISSQYIMGLVNALKTVAETNGITIPDSFWPTTSDKGGFATLTSAQIAKFPTIYFEMTKFGSSSQTITLGVSPSTYFQTREDGQRFLGIQPTSGSLYILGTVFMENFIVLHDRGTLDTGQDNTAKLGFYPIAGYCK